MYKWHTIFKKMYEAKIKNIIFVPTELCTDKDFENEKNRHKRLLEKGKEDVFCGWLYSEDEFIKMFRDEKKRYFYEIKEKIQFDNSAVYVLNRNKL